MLGAMRSLGTFLRLSPWVLGSTFLAIIGLLLSRAALPVASLEPSSEEVGTYLQTLGGIYAVLLAFVVFVVWQQFNEARAGVEREASEIMDLFRSGDGLPQAARTELHTKLIEYATCVLEIEWLAMARGRDNGEASEATQHLDQAWRILNAFEPSSECHKALYSEALSCFNELSNARTARLSASRTRIPAALRMLLYIGAVVLVASTWLLAVESFEIHAFITGALAGSVSHLLYVIEDLDDAFSGGWQVPKKAFERARAFMIERRDRPGS